jgi:hypothetical protein
MSNSFNPFVASALAAATVIMLAAPVQAAPFAKDASFDASQPVEQVSWRGRRNTALVAGALGLTALGIAAAAASQPRYGYGDGYGPYDGYGPAYGYEPAYAPRYAPRRYDDYGYAPRYAPAPAYGYGHGYGPRYVEERPVYSPRQRARLANRPFVHDYGRGPEFGRDPAGSK